MDFHDVTDRVWDLDLQYNHADPRALKRAKSMLRDLIYNSHQRREGLTPLVKLVTAEWKRIDADRDELDWPTEFEQAVRRITFRLAHKADAKEKQEFEDWLDKKNYAFNLSHII